MKNTPPHVYRGLGILLVLAALFVSCEAPMSSSPRRVALDGASGAATVLYQPVADGSIQSLTATVTSYKISSKPGAETISESNWRLSTKIIDGRLFLRIDYPSDQTPDLRPRSILSNGEQSVLFYRDTAEIISRQAIPQPEGMPIPRIASLSPRVDLDQVINQAQRLLWDVDGSDPKRLGLILPVSSRIDSVAGNEKSIHQKIFYDTELQIPSGVETVEIDENGQKITTTVEMFSAEIDGIPLHLGQMTTMTFTGEIVPENSSRLVPNQDLLSVDNLEVANEGELEALREQGYSVVPFISDDGGKVSTWTETIIEAYDDIEINTAEELTFRLFF